MRFSRVRVNPLVVARENAVRFQGFQLVLPGSFGVDDAVRGSKLLWPRRYKAK
jgi:hypothetical protein